MYKNFRIENYKLFNELNIDGLKRVNVISGGNNSGKTTILESIFIHSGAYNPSLLFSPTVTRGVTNIPIDLLNVKDSLLSYFYHCFNINNKIVFKSNANFELEKATSIELIFDQNLILNYFQDKGFPPTSKKDDWSLFDKFFAIKLSHEQAGEVKTAYIFFNKNGAQGESPSAPQFQCVFVATGGLPKDLEIQWINSILIEKKENLLIDALQSIDNRVKAIHLLNFAGVQALYVDIGLSKMMPLPLLGEGMVRLCNYVLAITAARNGVVLIDEVENGFHYSIYGKLWKLIDNLSRNLNVQVFCTSHSRECSVAAHEYFSSQDEYNLKYFRVQKAKNKFVAIDYEKDVMTAAIESNMEIR